MTFSGTPAPFFPIARNVNRIRLFVQMGRARPWNAPPPRLTNKNKK